MKKSFYIDTYNKELLDLFKYFNNNKSSECTHVDKTFCVALVAIENKIAETYYNFDDVELLFNLNANHGLGYTINDIHSGLNGTERSEIISLIERAAKTGEFEVVFTYSEYHNL